MYVNTKEASHDDIIIINIIFLLIILFVRRSVELEMIL